jgi:hypothetical protein
MKPEVVIDGVIYVPKESAATPLDGLEYKIVRSLSAGVFAGYLEKREGEEVTLVNVRRIWKWSGAASCSQLAMEGVSDPDNCKFPIEVSRIHILKAIEILDCTERARLSIKGVEIWQA